MKLLPSKFRVDCPEHLGYYFDESTNTGFLQGHPIIEVGENGDIDIAAPDGLSTVFDDLGLASDSTVAMYQWVQSGDCTSAKMDFIDSFQECEAAALSLGFNASGRCYDASRCQANAVQNCRS